MQAAMHIEIATSGGAARAVARTGCHHGDQAKKQLHRTRLPKGTRAKRGNRKHAGGQLNSTQRCAVRSVPKYRHQHGHRYRYRCRCRCRCRYRSPSRLAHQCQQAWVGRAQENAPRGAATLVTDCPSTAQSARHAMTTVLAAPTDTTTLAIGLKTALKSNGTLDGLKVRLVASAVSRAPWLAPDLPCSLTATRRASLAFVLLRRNYERSWFRRSDRRKGASHRHRPPASQRPRCSSVPSTRWCSLT